ncbi:hypothetical protein L7F22_027214 [Adiantum nelumboides]|nr:hypothetical protein [Adiantum nelumboides]
MSSHSTRGRPPLPPPRPDHHFNTNSFEQRSPPPIQTFRRHQQQSSQPISHEGYRTYDSAHSEQYSAQSNQHQRTASNRNASNVSLDDAHATPSQQFSAGHDSASMYAPMQSYDQNTFPDDYQETLAPTSHNHPSAMPSTGRLTTSDAEHWGSSSHDISSYTRDWGNNRPVSSTPSNIIALYASSDNNENSYSTIASAADSYLQPSERSSSSGAGGLEGGQPTSDSYIVTPTSAEQQFPARRPLPQIPQNCHVSQQSKDHSLHSDEPVNERYRTPLPPPPLHRNPNSSQSVVSIEEDALKFYSSQNGQASYTNTPSIGEHSTTVESNSQQPQTPPTWSPPSAFRPTIPSRKGTPTINDSAQQVNLTSPDAMPINAHPPRYDEVTNSSLNRSKSIVGKTIIAPGSNNRLTQLTLPPRDAQRVQEMAHSTMQNGIRNGEKSSWEMQFADFLSPGFIQDETSSPNQDDPDFSLLSNIALLLRDAIPRGTQVKGSVSYPHSFTGKDVVSTIESIIPKDNLDWAAQGMISATYTATDDRQIALCMAKSLKKELFFHEVDWGTSELQDGVEEVYMFLEDSMGEHVQKANDFDVELSRASFGGNQLHKGQMTRANELVDLPTGVFTPLTSCYSPLCGNPNAPPNKACYSYSCPRSQQSKQVADDVRTSVVEDASTAKGTKPVTGASHNAVAWSDTVSAELLKTLSKDEIKRQNAILELIQKEEEFLNDLELLENLFLNRLLRSPAVTDDQSSLHDEAQREDFIQEVFSNHIELTNLIRVLVEKLHIRQREDGPVVRHIGDIYLDAALEWGSAFETNMTSFPMAKHRLQRESSRIPLLATFLEECRRDPACHKLPMDHFLQRATTRLPRYNLHFKSIVKDTDETNADRQSLTQAVELVDEQCKAIQKGVAAAETKVKIREYAFNLSTKRNKVAIHMDLLNPERQLVHQGRVYRKPDFTDFEWQDLLAVLFDNYFVITKTKKREEGDRMVSRFVLEKRPIAVEMIQIAGSADPPVSRSLGLSNFHLRTDRENRDLFPLTITHLAGKTESLTLYTANKNERDEWRAKIEEAIGLRLAVQEANKLFEVWPISSDLFALPPVNSLDPEKPPPGVSAADFHGSVTCAVPFKTRDGRRLIAISCADGVWIGLRNDAKSLRKVLHLKLVMQCAVLEAFGIFVVLADKVLISYSLDALVPSANSPSNPRPPQKLSGNRDVMFFAVGQVKDRTLLVYMKKKPNESVFRALEPVAAGVKGDHTKGGSGGGGLFGKFGKDSRSSDWFREYKTFFIPSEAYSMQFLRSKLCIVCARGFEIIDLDHLYPGTIPDFSSTRDDPKVYALNRRIETVKPLGMFKNREGEFILCYDEFACFVDRHGTPIKLDQIIEWEGVPHSTAFKEPFLLAFDARFIEVRDSISGQLVQLIRTNELRNMMFSSSTMSDEEDAIILVQRTRSSQRRTYDFQQVFELIGTMNYQHYSRGTTQLQLQQMQSVPSSATSELFTHSDVMYGNMQSINSPESTYFASTITGSGSGASTTSPTLHRQGTTATTATTWTSRSNGSSQGGGGGGSRRWI